MPKNRQLSLFNRRRQQPERQFKISDRGLPYNEQQYEEEQSRHAIPYFFNNMFWFNELGDIVLFLPVFAG
jgi:hypothetical protein